jgi:cellobiose phosphorylase
MLWPSLCSRSLPNIRMRRIWNAHHPGRFVYVKDEETGKIFSAPYEPVRVTADNYTFSIGKSNILWKVECDGILIEMSLRLIQRGQLPVFIPNYYRGAYRQIPRTAGRSSHLFNTGTVPWVYRCLIDGLFGLQGSQEGLQIKPQLPSERQWTAY